MKRRTLNVKKVNRLMLSIVATEVQNLDDVQEGFEYKQKFWQPVGELQLSDIRLLLENAEQLIDIEDSNANQQLQLVCFWYPNTSCSSNVFDVVVNTLFHNTNISRPSIYKQSDSEQVLQKRYVTTQLFDALFKKHAEEEQSEKITELKLPNSFQPTLRPYQINTVRWLMKREQIVQRVPPFYTRLKPRVPNLQCLVFKHNYCQLLLIYEPNEIVLPPGGILADEMGLGKTVEMLALILLHPYIKTINPPKLPHISDEYVLAAKRSKQSVPDVFCFCTSRNRKVRLIKCTRCARSQHAHCVTYYNAQHDDSINNPYICPSCWANYMDGDVELLPTGATFIATPATIRTQWLRELQRHIKPSLRVLIYQGVVSSGKWISPRQLAEYDVVLCDYNVIRNEMYHTAEHKSPRVTRNEPIFMRLHTPLLMLNWWRVCLDEAQMVESNTSKLAALLRTLTAVNRWAVTGTPIQKSLDDLVPLLRFVGFPQATEPISVWNTLVNDFVERHQNTSATQPNLIDKVLCHCMWRTCKSKVIDQLNIPPQSMVLHRIELSNIEKLFYNEMHNDCEEKFRLAIDKYVRDAEKSVRTISPQTLALILNPLLKLRQSCNIPVLINSNQNSAFGTEKQFMQPEQLHKHLRHTNILACKTELRSMASSCNGMAANYFLRQNYDEAIECYKLVLKLANDYKETPYYVDSLLQIHALYNMLQAYYSSNMKLNKQELEGYETEYHALEAKFLEPYKKQLVQVQNAYNTAWLHYTENNKETVELVQLLSKAVMLIEDNNSSLEEPLMQRIYDECLPMFSDKPTLDVIRSTRGILYVIEMWYQKTNDTLSSIQDKLEKLKFFTDNVGARNQIDSAVWRLMMQFTNSVSDCHLNDIRKNPSSSSQQQNKSTKKKKSYCDLCKINQEINQFECLLFRKTIDEQTNLTEGISIPSAEVTLIKTMWSFLKSRHCFSSLHTQIDNQMEILENMQTIMKRLTKYWIEFEYAVKAYDELDMCKMRMSLRDENDSEDEEGNMNWRICEAELESNLVQQKMNWQHAQQQFVKKLARLKYIMHLEEHTDPGECPICHTEDDIRYIVLECGHHICLTCLNNMRKYKKSVSITCVICRNHQNADNIYYATRSTTKDAENEIEVQGLFSSKIMEIVRLVLKMKQDYANNLLEDEPKILIFSQWQPILNAIAKALAVNDIKHCTRWSPETIDEFKNANLGITCLLMTFKHGSKGLNLIEANTVILVEPILNPGAELQALGRVHRFGQTKPTSVHRFIVNGTIEERIYSTINNDTSANADWTFDNMSLTDLRNLFQLEDNCNT